MAAGSRSYCSVGRFFTMRRITRFLEPSLISITLPAGSRAIADFDDSGDLIPGFAVRDDGAAMKRAFNGYRTVGSSGGLTMRVRVISMEVVAMLAMFGAVLCLRRNRRASHRRRRREPNWTNWWANRWTLRRGRMRGAPIGRSRRNRKRISSPGASNGSTRCIGRPSPHCLQQQLKSIYYDMPDLLKPLPPQPKGRLQAGLLWTGGVAEYQVELHWPAGVQEIPSPEAVEVRVYPTSFGWFGWTVDKILGNPEISADRRTWTYKSDPAAKMDSAYSVRVDAATEMVAVFYEEGKTPGGVKSAVPSIRVIGPSMGEWKRMDVEMEWGFQAGTEKADFDGRLESYVAMVGPVSPLADDKGTTVTGAHSWQSRAAGDARRGIVVPLLYAPGSRPGLDSRVTVWTKTAGFTFRLRDLENGPILIPEHGVFVTKAGSGKTARQFAAELAAKNLKSIRQMTREHREAASWEEVMREVRLWTCPAGTAVPPFPKVEDPPMQVQLPDPRWTDAWRAASYQLRGKHMWGGLAFEVGRVAHEMDMVGLHDEADKVYEHFLKAPGAKSDGDYSDGNGRPGVGDGHAARHGIQP